ncbi:MAG TPA: DUF3459 domain-containing protein, partial [Ruania sp.]|nr:DUF3459 domain-containing protein [Ruania sp.]
QEIYPPGTQAPDPQDPHTRDVSVLRHDEAQHGRHRRIRDFYRRLLQLRAHQGQLRSGDRTSTHAAYCPDGSWFVLTRADIHVLLTRAPARERVQVPLPGSARMQQLLSWSGTGTLQEETAELAGVDVLVLLAEGGTHR